MTAYLNMSERYEEAYGAGLLSVSSRLVLNDTEGALEKLTEVAADLHAGLYYGLILERSSIYDPIRNEPAYIALLEEYKTNAEQQRQLLEEMNL